MSEVFNLGKGNWAGRYQKMLAYKVDNGNYIANELSFTRTTTGTFVNQNGFIEEQELRVPRVDYLNNSNGTLLLEPQRTNEVTYSEDYSSGSWVKSNTTTIANDTISPRGTQDASKIHPNSNGNYRHIRNNSFNPSSGLYTFSIFAKAGELDHLVLIDYDGSGIGIDFDLTNGVATDNATSPFDSFSMTDVGDGWYRCLATATDMYFYWILSDNGGLSVTANGTDGLYIWGAMAETGSFPTSYIPTTGTSVTRTYDYFNGIFEEVTTQGTIFIDFEKLTQSGASYRFRSINYNVAYAFYFYGGGMDVYNGSAFMVDRTTLEPDNSKIAVSWNGTNVKIFINGNNRTKSNAVASIYNVSRITFQDQNNIGNLNEVKVYNTELTDEELINLTT